MDANRNQYLGVVLGNPHRDGRHIRLAEDLPGTELQRAALRRLRNRHWLIGRRNRVEELTDDWYILDDGNETLFVYAPQGGVSTARYRTLMRYDTITAFRLPWPDEYLRVAADDPLVRNIPDAIRKRWYR